MKYIKTFESHEVFTNGNFWGTVGAGLLPVCSSTGRILLGLRSKYVNEPETWAGFGGKLDDMETNDPQEAAKQEFMEETGYDGDINLITSYVFRTQDKRFTYHNFIGVLEHEFEPRLNWETDSSKWVTFEEMMKISPKHFGLKELLKNDIQTIEKIINELKID